MNVYQQLHDEAVSALLNGKPQLDAHLPDKAGDNRRGLTLVARPSQAIRRRVALCLERVAKVCPGQHYYKPEELHVTVLSIISGTESWRQEMMRFPLYRSILAAELRCHRPFKVSFRGLTASPGSVMVQGFPSDDGVSAIRDNLREAFARSGFQGLLDRRYKISTAHMTIQRFCRPVEDVHRLLELLEEVRNLDFGEMEITRLQLIWGDWYASSNVVRTLQEYDLTRKA